MGFIGRLLLYNVYSSILIPTMSFDLVVVLIVVEVDGIITLSEVFTVRELDKKRTKNITKQVR